MINYQEIKPGNEQLVPYIDSYVYISGEKTVSKDIFPQTGASLVIDFCGNILLQQQALKMAIIGFQETPYRLRTRTSANDRIIIKFSSFGLHTFSRLPASDLTNRFIDAVDIFGAEITGLYLELESDSTLSRRILLIEAFLLRNMIEPSVGDRMIFDLANSIKHNFDSSSFSFMKKSLHLSTRQVERKFKTLVGTTISHYLKVVRFNRAKDLLEKKLPNRLTDIAFESGYYDQSHFISNFKALTGASPKHFSPCS
jgi:AraC-like DNA-binding protein